MSYLRPDPLTTGDRVAVLSVSGPVDARQLEAGVQVLRSWGLEVDVLASARAEATPFDYLAGDDRRRADDLVTALTDDRYRAVLLAKGGYGAQRTMELIDWDEIVAADPSPRIVTGFSDVTALQEAVLRYLGWASLYAAMPATWYFLAERAQESVRRALFGTDSGTLTFPDADPLVPGVAEGVLLGGCATLIAGSIGTDTAVPGDGGIIFLEDVDEELFRLDRLFTQLRRSGYFDAVTGVVTGTFDGCGDPGLVRQLLVDRLADLGVPVLAGADIGHGVALQALPLGRRARLDTAAGTLTLLD